MKKLELKKEIVEDLNSEDLNKVQGGNGKPDWTDVGPSCKFCGAGGKGTSNAVSSCGECNANDNN